MTLWRVRQKDGKLAHLRRLQLLCKYHFGNVADLAFDDIQGVLAEIILAANSLVQAARQEASSTQDEAAIKRVVTWKDIVWWDGTDEENELAAKVAAAQRSLEAALMPHLRADAALWPVAKGWRSLAGRLSARTPD
jgi:hypothetical protein